MTAIKEIKEVFFIQGMMTERSDAVKAVYALSLEQRQTWYEALSNRWHEVVNLKSQAFAGLSKPQRAIVNELRKQPQDWIELLSNM